MQSLLEIGDFTLCQDGETFEILESFEPEVRSLGVFKNLESALKLFSKLTGEAAELKNCTLETWEKNAC